MTITRGIGINKKTLKNIPERVLQDKPNFPEPLFNINMRRKPLNEWFEKTDTTCIDDWVQLYLDFARTSFAMKTYQEKKAMFRNFFKEIDPTMPVDNGIRTLTLSPYGTFTTLWPLSRSISATDLLPLSTSFFGVFCVFSSGCFVIVILPYLQEKPRTKGHKASL
jgi:hypothetical protein